VAPHDRLSDEDSGLISAAQAAASWARARRATWTTRPLGMVDPPPAAPPDDVVAAAPPVSVPIHIDSAPPRAPVPVPYVVAAGRSHPSDAVPAEETAPWSFAGAPIVTWAVRAGVAAALVAVAAIGWPYLSSALSTIPKPPAVVKKATETRPPAGGRKGSGNLRVSSTPTGAQVLVDGKARGVTPLTLADLSPGTHELELKSEAGSVTRTVTIAANQTATVEESIFSGWVTVFSPFEVVITEGGRVLRADDRNQVMLPPGTHELRLTNRALGYQVARKVEVKPGEGATVQVTPGPSTLTVTANEAAQVWIDGTRAGETPLNGTPVPLGTHDILVKSTTGSERRFTVTIGVSPYTLNVDF
jgi:hypothetical protein